MKTIMDAVNYLKGDLENTCYGESPESIYLQVYLKDGDYVTVRFDESASGDTHHYISTTEEFTELVSQLETNFGNSITYSEYKAKYKEPELVYTQEFKVRGGNSINAVYQPCKVVYQGSKYTVLINENGREFSRRTAKLDIRDIDTRTDKEKANALFYAYVKGEEVSTHKTFSQAVIDGDFGGNIKWVANEH